MLVIIVTLKIINRRSYFAANRIKSSNHHHQSINQLELVGDVAVHVSVRQAVLF